jgi:hypothetical protein
MVAVLSPRIAPLIERFGATRLIALGLASTAAGYALFLPIGLDSSYATAMFPTFVLAGLGFALAYGPLNVAATNGVAPEEQGLARAARRRGNDAALGASAVPRAVPGARVATRR